MVVIFKKRYKLEKYVESVEAHENSTRLGNDQVKECFGTFCMECVQSVRRKEKMLNNMRVHFRFSFSKERKISSKKLTCDLNEFCMGLIKVNRDKGKSLFVGLKSRKAIIFFHQTFYISVR